MKKIFTVLLIALVIAFSATITFSDAAEKPPIMNNPHVVKQLRHDLLVQVAKWAMPAVSFFANKQALINDFGVETGTIVYWSKPFGAEVKLLTPNDTSLYFTTQIELFDGPVTIEIPPVHESGLNFFGTIMNAWQTPIEDVGPKGWDKGKGSKYFITPPNYKGKIPDDVIHRESSTYNVVAGFRVTPKSFRDEDLKAAADYGKTMKLYSDKTTDTKFFDAYGKAHNPLPPYNAEFFSIIHHFVNTEPMFEYDACFYEILKQFGIAKGSKFKSITEMEASLVTMRDDLRDEIRRDMGSMMFPNANWQLPIDLIVEAASQFTYRVGNEYDWQRRAVTFHWAVWAPKYLGEATFYTLGQFDQDGKVLDGGSTYKLNVPSDVPAAQFWSATVYSMDTYAFYDDVHTVALNSLQEDLVVNKDGSTDVYFAPSLPKGVGLGNWVPTRPDSEFFVLFRWYGPKPELFNGAWTMGDLVKQK
jgi:hypothetical protein